MSAGPMFSVVVPTYNREGMVVETLESIYAQRFTDYEVIAVNDGSKDGTLGVLRAHEPRIRVIDQANKGLAGARNTGAAAARGRYVIFLDSDDVFFPWTLAAMAEQAERHNNPAIISGDFRAFSDRATLPVEPQAPAAARHWPDYLAAGGRAQIAPSATALRLDVLREAGYGEETRVMFEEVDLWFKVGARPGFVFIDKPSLVGYRVGHASMMGHMQKQLDGYDWMASRVRSGLYGPRRREMMDILGVYARGAAFRCMHTRDRKRAMAFYQRAAGVCLRRGDVKYLVGMPVIVAMGRSIVAPHMRGLGLQVTPDE